METSWRQGDYRPGGQEGALRLETEVRVSFCP